MGFAPMSILEILNFIKWLCPCFAISFLMRPYLRVRNLRFFDGGFSLSFGLGTALSFFCSWVASAVLSFPFDERCMFVLLLLGALPAAGVLYKCRKTGNAKRVLLELYFHDLKGFAIGFLAFCLLLAAMVWIRGFIPEITPTTEKYMDFGFVEAIWRQKSAIPEDIWYSGKTLNYYYLGHACTAYLCRLSAVLPDYGYTFMLSTVFAACALMTFSIAQGFLCALFCAGESKQDADQKQNETGEQVRSGGRLFGRRTAAAIGGIFASLASCLAGNGHYLCHGILLPLVSKLTKQDLKYRPEGYFFADSTVYVGAWPDLPDKGKNEFIAYSVILGDLHAHYLNLLFVLPFLAIALDYAIDPERKTFAKRMLDTRYLLLAVLLSLFMGTNYWDFPIYFVIAGALILFHDLNLYVFSLPCGEVWRRTDSDGSCRAGSRAPVAFLKLFGEVLVRGAAIFAIAKLLAYPFESRFIKMASKIRLAQNHTQLYKFAILWGLPFAICIGLLVFLFVTCRNETQKKLQNMLPLLAILAVILCAIGLTLVPEVIYVEDIYGEAYARFNTMFKLTYQAFLLLAIASGIAVGVFWKKKKLAFAVPTAVIILLLCGFFIVGLKQFAGNVFEASRRKGADVCDFLYTDGELYAEMSAIHVIREDGREHVRILEAAGESYQPDCKVSVMTGACTYAGWGVHEWMWRGSWDVVGLRFTELGHFYQDGDPVYCRDFVNLHQIDYIFVGPRECAKYAVDLSGFSDLGEEIILSEDGYRLYRID